MSAKAVKTGSVKINGETWTLTFDAQVPGYHVHKADGEYVFAWRGVHITRAKRELRAYFAVDGAGAA